MNKAQLCTVVVAIGAMLVFAGCSNSGASVSSTSQGNDVPTAAKVDTSPVTLKVFNSVSINDQDFTSLFVDPVKKKYPNISLQQVVPGKGANIEDLVASGDIPDILIPANAGLTKFQDLGLLDDIAPLVKKQNIDLSRFNPVMLDAAKTGGVLHGLPFAVNFNALYYNKDIFDKFAVSYPKDGLTWDETLELTKKLTRTDGGVDYHGLDPTNINLISFPFAVAYVDAKTERASVNNEQWKTIFKLAHDIYTIPGNGVMEGGTGGPGPAATRFLKNKNVAMVTAVNILTFFEKVDDVKWDMAQFPSYKEKPGISGKVDAHLLLVAKTSKLKDQAMQVIGVVTSDDVQLQSVKGTLRVSPLLNKEMQTQFGADLAYLKGRNLQSIFKGKIVAAPEYSPYNGMAQNIASQQFFNEYLPGKKDLNTVLSDTDTLINQMLDSNKK